MLVDKDGKICMDCFSFYVMVGLLCFKDDFDVVIGNDFDVDCYGVVIKDGLMNFNYYFVVMIEYLFQNCFGWQFSVGVGKMLVSLVFIDWVVVGLGWWFVEVLVGFKYFVEGLFLGEFGFGGEELVGVSFLRFDGGVWSIDKDGLIFGLFVVEMMVWMGKMFFECLCDLIVCYGEMVYSWVDVFVNVEQKKVLLNFLFEQVMVIMLVGDFIIVKLICVFGNDVVIGGFKVIIEYVWFVVWFSGIEDVYKIYGESFWGEEYL